MRLFPVLAIALVVAFAGCAKKNDDGGATTSTTTTPPTSTSSTSTTTTSTPASTTTPTNTTPTTPTAPQPMEITATADFASNAGPPPAAPPAKAITIPSGYTMGNLTVTWTCNQDPLPCAATPDGPIDVKVSGLTCTLPSGPVGGAAGAIPKCTKTGPVTPGDTKIVYDGVGPVTAKIVFTLT